MTAGNFSVVQGEGMRIGVDPMIFYLSRSIKFVSSPKTAPVYDLIQSWVMMFNAIG